MLAAPTREVLQAAFNQFQFEVWVPDIVVEEAVAQVHRELEDASRLLRKAEDAIRSLAPSAACVPPALDVVSLVEDYRARLIESFEAIAGTIVATSFVDHQEIMKRSVERRKPFGDSGKGYADSLVWKSVVQALSHCEDVVYLVTRNTTDFCDPAQPTRLHPHLCEELKRCGVGGGETVFDPEPVTVRESLAALAELDVAPRLEAASALAANLPRPAAQGAGAPRRRRAGRGSEHSRADCRAGVGERHQPSVVENPGHRTPGSSSFLVRA